MRRRLLISYLSITLFVLVALALPLGLSFDNAEHRRLTSQVQSEAYVYALRVDEILSGRVVGRRAARPRPDVPPPDGV